MKMTCRTVPPSDSCFGFSIGYIMSMMKDPSSKKPYWFEEKWPLLHRCSTMARVKIVQRIFWGTIPTTGSESRSLLFHATWPESAKESHIPKQHGQKPSLTLLYHWANRAVQITLKLSLALAHHFSQGCPLGLRVSTRIRLPHFSIHSRFSVILSIYSLFLRHPPKLTSWNSLHFAATSPFIPNMLGIWRKIFQLE